jgi:hypothetical protein
MRAAEKQTGTAITNLFIRACPTPPNPPFYKNIGKLFQILNRLVTSLTDGRRWFFLNVLLLSGVLTSTSIFSPLGYTMNSLANEFEGQMTPVLEVYNTGERGEYIELSNSYLGDREELRELEIIYSTFNNYCMKLLTEENAIALEDIDGVETVVRALYYDAETTYEQWVTPTELEERESSLLEVKEEYPEYYSSMVDEWELSGVNVSLAEYNFKVHSHYTLGMLCVEVGKIDGWSLGFNELMEGAMVKPGEALRATVNRHLLDGVMLNIDREDPVRLLIGHSIDRIELYFRNDTSHVYDFEIVGVLTQTSRDWSSGSAIDGHINIMADLNPFMEILQDENHMNGVPLPRYTSLYVKPTTSMDLPHVEKEIKRLLPEAEVKRAGKAPLTISNIVQVSAMRYGLLSAGSVLLLGAALVSSQVYEAYKGRKQIWLLRARGWGSLDIVSYTLLRAAVTGIVAGIIAAVIMLLAQGKIANSIMLSEVVSTSPMMQHLLSQALSGFPTYATIFNQPLIGVTASVITCTITLLYSVITRPRSPILTVTAEGNIDK